MQPIIAGKKLVFAPILRAGVGFLDGMLELVPAARVAHIGLYRDPETLQAVEYYFKAPSDVAERMIVVMDPMLATANSAVAAIDRLKERGARDLRFVCLLAAPEGIERLRGAHPDVPHLDGGDRRAPQRARLYRAGPRRRRRPHVRHALTPKGRPAPLLGRASDQKGGWVPKRVRPSDHSIMGNGGYSITWTTRRVRGSTTTGRLLMTV